MHASRCSLSGKGVWAPGYRSNTVHRWRHTIGKPRRATGLEINNRFTGVAKGLSNTKKNSLDAAARSSTNPIPQCWQCANFHQPGRPTKLHAANKADFWRKWREIGEARGDRCRPDRRLLGRDNAMRAETGCATANETNPVSGTRTSPLVASTGVHSRHLFANS